MKLIEYSDVNAFLERTRSFLESDQALYGLALGNAIRIAEGHRFGAEDPWFAVVEEGPWLRAIVLQTPPHAMMLVTAELEAITPLIEGMRKSGRTIPGVVGPADTVPFVTGRWAHIHDLDQKVRMHMHLFCADKVIPPSAPPAGEMVKASPEDLTWLSEWTTGFSVDCHMPPNDPALPEPAVPMVEQERLFLWKDATGPKAMAAFTRETPQSYSVSWVYTPKEQRGKGYASALVAELTQHALDSGKQFCSLYTDVTNPTSKKIYAEVGYRHYCDVQHVDFVAKE